MVTREYYKTFKVGLPFRGKIPRPLGNVPGRPVIYILPLVPGGRERYRDYLIPAPTGTFPAVGNVPAPLWEYS